MAKPLTEYLWIVDGHNLVLNVPELSRLHSHESKRAARDAAEARLAELARVSPNPVHLIFDGDAMPGAHPGSGERGGLVVRFVDPPAEADDWIVRLAKQESEAGKPVAVATSDRGLLARLAGGAPVHRMAVDAFWRETGRFARQLAGPAPKEKPDPRDSSVEDLVALENAMTRPLPQETRPAAPRATAPGGARASSAGDASRERSHGHEQRDAKESRSGAGSSRGTHAVRGAHGPSGPRSEHRDGKPPRPSSQAEPAQPHERGASDMRASAPPPPPPPPPPRDWRDEIAEKKEKGRQRQLKRLARRKGS